TILRSCRWLMRCLMQGHSSSSAWASSSWLCWSIAARAVWVNPSCAATWMNIRRVARTRSPLPLQHTCKATTWPCGGPRRTERFGMRQLTQTPLGGRVICEERDLLYEEAPAAYKNIEAVIQKLVDAGLASVIATFRPLLTYKTRALRR